MQITCTGSKYFHEDQVLLNKQRSLVTIYEDQLLDNFLINRTITPEGILTHRN